MKGLFLICTLIGLVGFTNSQLDKGELAELKEKYQQAKKNVEQMKEARSVNIGSYPDLMSDYIDLMDSLMAQGKKYAEKLPIDFLPLESLMKKLKEVFVKTKASIDKADDYWGAKIENFEREMKETEKLINYLEEQQAEL